MTAPIRCELNVVAFDICDDRRRRRAVCVLERYGLRILESVFECWLDPARRKQLARRLQAVLLASEDLLEIRTLSAEDSRRAWHIGKGPGLSTDPARWILAGEELDPEPPAGEACLHPGVDDAEH